MLVARLGGDEFLAVMTDVDAASAVAAAEAFVAGIEDLGATLTRFPLSASVGIASGTVSESAEQLLRRADQAMYRAKARGPGKCELAREHETAEPGRISAAGPISTVS